jgi:RES domain-containing protein
VIAYRIGGRAHPLLDGGGASASSEARWNSRGRHVIYASEHYATAVLEKAAQLSALRLPPTLVYIRIDVPASASIEEVEADALPQWDADDKASSQAYGDGWYDEQRSLVLLVPSLAAPGIERNVLINQRHPEFAGVRATTEAGLVCHPRLRLTLV